MGQPVSSNIGTSRLLAGKLTLGSETSQYQEEKKPNSILLVAASEQGTAQTQTSVKAYWRCLLRVAGYCRKEQ